MAEVPLKKYLFPKSAFSCEACRKRKVKCNGASPSCSRCVARGEECIYSLPPTLSYTKQLEARVAQLEAALADLRSQQASDEEERRRFSPASTRDESLGPSNTRCGMGQQEEVQHILIRDFDELQFDRDGGMYFSGLSSKLQSPSVVLSGCSASASLVVKSETQPETPMSNISRNRTLEAFAVAPEFFQYLLDSYLSWVQPVFHFVYQPAFLRDMRSNGPYCSGVLLNAVLSHSLQLCKLDSKISSELEHLDGGSQFFHSALSGVQEVVKVGHAQVSTIQALLILSAQDCAMGNRVQAWLYSGMAFRLLDDLELPAASLDPTRVGDEEAKIRNRLFWSCYLWDKLISLFFGRAPVIQHSSVSPCRTILDDTSEIDHWTPHGVTLPLGSIYPSSQAYSVSCFTEMCRLAEILNQILIYMYKPSNRASEIEFLEYIQELDRKLKEWWEELSPFLKIEVSNLPVCCPPSHILALNCLYHTINILIHRPFFCSPQVLQESEAAPHTVHFTQCASSATAISSLFDLYRRTFGDGRVVFPLAYSIYTATSILLLEIQVLKFASPVTLNNLKFCLFALERVKITNPVMTTALSSIYQELQNLQIDFHVAGGGTRANQPQEPQNLQQAPQVQLQRHPPSSDHPQFLYLGYADHVSSLNQQPRDQLMAHSIVGSAAPNVPAGIPPQFSFHESTAPGFELSPSVVPEMSACQFDSNVSQSVMAIHDGPPYDLAAGVFEGPSFPEEPFSFDVTPESASHGGWLVLN